MSPHVDGSVKVIRGYSHTMSERQLPIDRRQLLRIGAVGVSSLALARALSACGGSDGASNSAAAGSDESLDGPISADMSIVQRWVPTELGVGFNRLPISLATDGGLLQKGPAQLTGRVLNATTAAVVAEGIVADRRSLGEGTIPFWVFTVNLPEPDIYALLVEGGPETGVAVQALDAADLVVVRPGDEMPAIDTPTVDDHRGVEPYCSRTPDPCPFHEVTLTEALASGKKVVFTVGTPAHCQTGVCAPVLEGMIDMAQRHSDVVFVHADVYADDKGTEIAPTVADLGLTFEPITWVIGADGIITHRFEGVWHPDEIGTALL